MYSDHLILSYLFNALECLIVVSLLETPVIFLQRRVPDSDRATPQKHLRSYMYYGSSQSRNGDTPFHTTQYGTKYGVINHIIWRSSQVRRLGVDQSPDLVLHPTTPFMYRIEG